MCPFIKIFNQNIPFYGVCITIAVMLCASLSIVKAHKFKLMLENMLIIIASSVGTGLFSGGLLYIMATYSIEEIYRDIINADFSFITNGGLVFYGGLLGGIFGALISAKYLNVKIEILEKCVVPYIPLGHAIGRVGCLMAGCCYGFEYDGIFSVKNKVYFSTITYFPIQAVEAVLNLLIMQILLLYVKKERLRYNVLFCYLINYSIMRFCIEFFRGDKERGIFMIFSTSQWISIFIFLFCIIGKKLLYNSSNNCD